MVRDERPHGFFYLAIVTKVGENGITVKYPGISISYIHAYSTASNSSFTSFTGWQGTSEAVELLGWQSDRVVCD